MSPRTMVYRFGFRLACLILLLIALSIAAMTYFFATREPDTMKEVSGWFQTVVMALVALLGGLAYRTLRWLSQRQQASTEEPCNCLSTTSESRPACQSAKDSPKVTSKQSSSGVRAAQPRRRRSPSKK